MYDVVPKTVVYLVIFLGGVFYLKGLGVVNISVEGLITNTNLRCT